MGSGMGGMRGLERDCMCLVWKGKGGWLGHPLQPIHPSTTFVHPHPHPQPHLRIKSHFYFFRNFIPKYALLCFFGLYDMQNQKPLGLLVRHSSKFVPLSPCYALTYSLTSLLALTKRVTPCLISRCFLIGLTYRQSVMWPIQKCAFIESRVSSFIGQL